MKSRISYYCLLGLMGLVGISFSQNSPITTPSSASSLNQYNVSSIQEFVRMPGMKKDSLLSEYTIDKKGECIKRKFRNDHTTNLWGALEYNYSEVKRIAHYHTSRWQNGKWVPVMDMKEEFRKDNTLFVKVVKEFDNYTTEIDTFLPNTEIVSQLFVTVVDKNDTIKMIRTYREGYTKIYYHKEKVKGEWVELDRHVTTHSKDGSFETFKHFKKGVLFNSYTQEDLMKKQKQDQQEIEVYDENPLPHSPPRQLIEKSYTQDPFSKKQVFYKIPSTKGGNHLWLDYFTEDGTNKVYLSEAYSPDGFLLMSWSRVDDRKVFYKYQK